MQEMTKLEIDDAQCFDRQRYRVYSRYVKACQMAMSVTGALGFKRIDQPLALEIQRLVMRSSSLHSLCSFTWNLFIFPPSPSGHHQFLDFFVSLGEMILPRMLLKTDLGQSTHASLEFVELQFSFQVVYDYFNLISLRKS